jgi:uncharacterized protein involved in tellurium resistance
MDDTAHCVAQSVSLLQEGVISHTRLDHKVTCIRAPQEAQMINLRYKILCYCYQKQWLLCAVTNIINQRYTICSTQYTDHFH